MIPDQEPHYQSEEHTEKAFAERIEALRATIRAKIPSGCSLQAFEDACKSFETSTASQKKAEDLLNALKKAKTDDDLIKKAQAVVDQCKEALEAMWTVEIETGQRLINDLDLLELEEALLECTILVQSTPKGLADFCAQDKANIKLVDKFLSNTDWMKLMLSNGGASAGNYGRAIQIHSDLLEQIHDNSTEIRRKLALAIALEHATPICYRFESGQCIDPSTRFWHYIHAHEKGELDSKFETFTVWELRLVVDSDASEEEMQWGRDYLKAYRPDQVTSPDDHWKYIWTVRTDINYHHPEHDFFSYKNLLSAGGVCGARAWFGRFIAKSFGMPTWGVRQPGHAAISRWTPTGWMTCLGGGYVASRWNDPRYGSRGERLGLDFEEETKARNNACPCDYYKSMCLLECLADSLGETVMQAIDSKKCWRSLSLVQRRVFAESPKDVVGELSRNVAASTIRKDTTPLESSCDETAGDVVVQQDKCYIIPASSFTNQPSKALLVMPSFLGGDQVHLSSAKYMGDDSAFNKLQDQGGIMYTIPKEIPKGFYTLSFKIVTVHRFQPVLHLAVEGFEENFDAVDIHEIEIPYTVGAWGKTQEVKIFLSPGTVLKLSRESPCHGLTMKELVLEPVS
ncbi:unnamed protein product [Cylindrotheca closterium]|uniref:Uncharacterized protein n=1 Tax=Cylindrotheca closterium TaxID=2856 RepID=A0AAD2CIV4_9STRA|nr:unnamed protein product [Cylindrotheca closterium]